MEAAEPTNAGYWSAWFLFILAYCSVDLFGMLSGYLNYDKKNFSAFRIVELIIIYFFWCVLFTVVLICTGAVKFNSFWDVIYSVFPSLAGDCWYITCYVALFFIMPYLNKLIDVLNESQMTKFVITLILVFSIPHTITGVDFFKMGSSTAWLAICYILGAYLAKYKKRVFYGKEVLVICLVCGCLLGIKGLIYAAFGVEKSLFIKHVSPFMLLCAALFIQLFSRIKMERVKDKTVGKFIVSLSVCSFDVYLVHGHTRIFDLFITEKFGWVQNFNFLMIILIVCAICAGIYFLSYILAQARRLLFKAVGIKKIINQCSLLLDKFFY